MQDEVFKWLLKKRWQPSIRTIAPWFDDDKYITNIANSIQESFKKTGKPEHLIVSFHGVPRRYLLLGDPYHCHCQKTGRLIKEKLKWPDNKFTVSFQSRFGPEEWLKPYTDETLIELAKNGTKKISIISPGFVTDCLETLDEIKNEALETFQEHGGKNLNYINWLKEKYTNKEIGYSGHEYGLATTFATISMGVKWIERHITLDRTMWGSDHKASIEPSGLIKLVKGIRDIEGATKYPKGNRILFKKTLGDLVVAFATLTRPLHQVQLWNNKVGSVPWYPVTDTRTK